MLYSFERTYRRQPSGLVSVDWQNPLADGLAMLAAPTRHQDWVRGRALTPSSATVGPGPAGQAWRMSGGSGSVLVPHDAGLNLTTQFTIFALVRSTEGSGAQYILNKNFDGSSSVPMSLAIGGTTVQQGAAFYRAPEWRSSGIGGVDIRGDGRVHAVAGSMDAVANLSYWVDGVRRAETNATTFPTATSTDVYIGRYQADSVSFRGDIYLVGITARAWSKSEHEAFAASPWQLFEPRRIWVPVSSGGLSAAMAEPASASEAVTSSYVGVAASSEAASAADSLAGAVSGIAALTEAATAADAQAAAYIAIASIAEAAAATDLLSAVATLSRAVAEAAAASDSITTGIQAFATQAEAAAALDAIAAVATLVAAVVEAATAADVQAATAQLVALLTETAVAADSVAAATPGVHNVSMAEIAAALDALAAWVDSGAQPLSAAPLVHRLQESVRAARLSSARSSRLNGRTR